MYIGTLKKRHISMTCRAQLSHQKCKSSVETKKSGLEEERYVHLVVSCSRVKFVERIEVAESVLNEKGDKRRGIKSKFWAERMAGEVAWL